VKTFPAASVGTTPARAAQPAVAHERAMQQATQLPAPCRARGASSRRRRVGRAVSKEVRKEASDDGKGKAPACKCSPRRHGDGKRSTAAGHGAPARHGAHLKAGSKAAHASGVEVAFWTGTSAEHRTGCSTPSQSNARRKSASRSSSRRRGRSRTICDTRPSRPVHVPVGSARAVLSTCMRTWAL